MSWLASSRSAGAGRSPFCNCWCCWIGRRHGAAVDQGAHLVDPAVPATTKPGSRPPGICLLSRGVVPGERAQGGLAQLCVGLGLATAMVVLPDQVFFNCGRSCRRWHLGPGVDWDVPLGPGHLRLGRERLSRERCSGRRQGCSSRAATTRQERHIWSKMLEQGPDRQRAPDWCSGGVSSICGASESRCSHDGSAGQGRQGQQRIRHRSSPAAIAVHEGGFMAPPAAAGGCPPGPAARPRHRTVPAAADPPRWRPAPEPC